MQANPDIEVVEEVVPWNQLQTQLLQASAAGRGPDVSRQLDAYVTMLARAGAILPLDQFVADWDDERRNDFLYPWDDTTFDGKKYAFRQSVRVANLNFYHTDIFSEAGYDTIPTSIEEFTTAAKAATKNEVVGFLMPFSKADNLNRFFQTVPPLFWAEGTDLVDPETGKALFHQETGQKIFQWFQDLIYVHEISPSGEATMDSEAANRMFASGTLASNWHHSSQWAEWIALAREGVLGTSFQPSFTGEIAPASTEGGWTLCMSKGADEEAAWKLIDFFQSNEAELIDAEVGGELPTRKSALDDPFFQGEEFARQREWLDYLAEHGHPATTIKIEHRQELANILGDAAQRIIAGQADVASTLTEAAAQYDALVGG
jgi:ABC-type glycerol-3-phosphate transport system substrate-binding protein